ncbi:MAG: hypothetical protein AAF493_05170 [Pseudomonadota bacterium]
MSHTTLNTVAGTDDALDVRQSALKARRCFMCDQARGRVRRFMSDDSSHRWARRRFESLLVLTVLMVTVVNVVMFTPL